MTTLRAPLTDNKAGLPQDEEQLTEVGLRDVLPTGNVLGLNRSLLIMLGQVEEGAQTVFAFARYPHSEAPPIILD
jgi:hypothetical protein